MTASLTPAATQSSTAPGTRSAETMISARSTGPGASFTLGYAGTPRISGERGLTGRMRPL